MITTVLGGLFTLARRRGAAPAVITGAALVLAVLAIAPHVHVQGIVAQAQASSPLLKDSIGRSWQVGTMQVDFQLPGRLGSEYVAEDNTRKVPVMLHRAIVGSMERFIGILVEHHAGAMPLSKKPFQCSP